MSTPPSRVDLIRARMLDLAGPDPHDSDTQLARQVLENVLARTAAAVTALQEAVARGDTRRTADLAHSLKGSLANIGGDACATILDRLELRARRGESGSPIDLRMLDTESRLFLRAVNDVLELTTQGPVSPGAAPNSPTDVRAAAPAAVPAPPIRVFVVDDQDVVRRGLFSLLRLEHDLEMVGEAGTVEEAIPRILAARPDVALLDVRLPDGNGVELCRELRTVIPGMRSIMLTAFDDDEASFEAVVAGAAGYVLKQVNGHDIVDAVRRVATGTTLLDPQLTQRVIDRLRVGAVRDSRLVGLTNQQQMILTCLADGKTNRQIAAEMFLAEKTVKNYVSGLLQKLGMSHRTEAAIYAVREEQRRGNALGRDRPRTALRQRASELS